DRGIAPLRGQYPDRPSAAPRSWPTRYTASQQTAVPPPLARVVPYAVWPGGAPRTVPKFAWLNNVPLVSLRVLGALGVFAVRLLASFCGSSSRVVPDLFGWGLQAMDADVTVALEGASRRFGH